MGDDEDDDGLLPHSGEDEDADNEDDSDKILISMKEEEKPQKAYTGFDDVSKKIANKIHGDLIQRFFHENPEDIEGHGEETALLALQQAVNESEKAIVQ